jgi:hypothetical protein
MIEIAIIGFAIPFMLICMGGVILFILDLPRVRGNILRYCRTSPLKATAIALFYVLAAAFFYAAATAKPM